MRGIRRTGLLPLLLGAVALLAAACGGSGGGADGGGGGMTLAIATPADGASVTDPFTIKVTSSVPLGKPDTGRHHVHVWFDGKQADYQVNYGDTFRVDALPAGRHVITAALANADHSLAGPRSQVTVTVTVTVGGGGMTATTAGAGGGYGGGYGP